MLSRMTYSTQGFRDAWDDLRNDKAWYDRGEKGWVKLLPEGRAVIANLPCCTRLHAMDVVELELRKSERELPVCGRVLWRGYERKLLLRYPTEMPQEPYVRLVNAFDDALLSYEGLVPGLSGLCCHLDSDPLQILEHVGLDITGITLEPWSEEASA